MNHKDTTRSNFHFGSACCTSYAAGRVHTYKLIHDVKSTLLHNESFPPFFSHPCSLVVPLN